jgi:hypothetical protein
MEGVGMFPKVIPPKTTVITKAVMNNLFCLRIVAIKDHIEELIGIEESSEWFKSRIKGYHNDTRERLLPTYVGRVHKYPIH